MLHWSYFESFFKCYLNNSSYRWLALDSSEESRKITRILLLLFQSVVIIPPSIGSRFNLLLLWCHLLTHRSDLQLTVRRDIKMPSLLLKAYVRHYSISCEWQARAAHDHATRGAGPPQRWGFSFGARVCAFGWADHPKITCKCKIIIF